jgi:hypothetical protein
MSVSNICCAGTVHSRPTLSFVTVPATALSIDKEIYWKEFPLEFSPLRKYMKDFTRLSVANLVKDSNAAELREINYNTDKNLG